MKINIATFTTTDNKGRTKSKSKGFVQTWYMPR